MVLAADELRLRLKVGRVLRGRPLVAVVALRELVVGSLLATTTGVAPSWVLVEDLRTGRVVQRVSAGRDPGVGEHLLERMQADLDSMGRRDFLARWA